MSNRIKVLLVDDHALFRSGMRNLLNFYDDIEVVAEASNGEQAIHCIAEILPDIILMDIDMPGEGGVLTCRSLQTTYPESRVILLSGHRRYVLSGLQAGAKGYVLKEAEEDIIVDAIRVVYGGGVYLQSEIQPAVVGGLQKGGISLTEREMAIVRLIADGATNREIGASLGLSEHRIKQCVSEILDRLGANDRAHAVAIALRSGLI